MYGKVHGHLRVVVCHGLRSTVGEVILASIYIDWGMLVTVLWVEECHYNRLDHHKNGSTRRQAVYRTSESSGYITNLHTDLSFYHWGKRGELVFGRNNSKPHHGRTASSTASVDDV